MLHTFVLADDFTGALDTGIKFASAGARTRVVLDANVDLSVPREEEVLVLCLPTRHVAPEEAYAQTRRVVERAAACGIGCIYKKTDSALRGNVGSELGGALDGSGTDALCFIPALPAMNRVTRGGIHYINDLPVAQSVFGKDPFEPVTESAVADLLHLQSTANVRLVPVDGTPDFDGTPAIHVFDCTSTEEMDRTLEHLLAQNRLKLMAGCAGLAEQLVQYLPLKKAEPEPVPGKFEKLLVVCGSVNPISIAQMDHGEQAGYPRLHLPLEELLRDDPAAAERLCQAAAQHDRLLIDALQSGDSPLVQATEEMSMEEIRQKISSSLGALLKCLADSCQDRPIMVIGGDTLLAFFEAIGCSELEPVCELQPGVVLSRIPYEGRTVEIISKSGGFGKPDLLTVL